MQRKVLVAPNRNTLDTVEPWAAEGHGQHLRVLERIRVTAATPLTSIRLRSAASVGLFAVVG